MAGSNGTSLSSQLCGKVKNRRLTAQGELTKVRPTLKNNQREINLGVWLKW
jgi:hypothetical protein